MGLDHGRLDRPRRRQHRATLVHVVGRFHVDFHGGTVQSLERRCVGVRAMTISFVDDASPLLRDEDQGRADFVIYVGLSER